VKHHLFVHKFSHDFVKVRTWQLYGKIWIQTNDVFML